MPRGLTLATRRPTRSPSRFAARTLAGGHLRVILVRARRAFLLSSKDGLTDARDSCRLAEIYHLDGLLCDRRVALCARRR